MAYTPINWQTGDTITAEKMNKMDNGWSVESAQLFSETVTTEDTGEGLAASTLTYAELISAESIVVMVNGTEYVCPRIDADGDNVYGGMTSALEPDFTIYPFFIFSMSGQNDFVTQTAGTYSVEASATTLEVSDAFKTAVNNVTPLPMLCVSGVTTYDEMIAAKNAKRLLYFWTEHEGYGCYIIRKVDYPCAINPTSTSVIANFDNNNVFVITEQ